MSSLSIGPIRREPSLVDKVVEELTEAIVSGQLPVGHRLPSERELGDQLGVSRTVVREAVRALGARRLVTITSGRGVEVASLEASGASDSLRLFIRGNQAFDYRKIHEVRSTIEVDAASLAAERATDSDIECLLDLCHRLDERLAAGDNVAASRLDFEFHRALALATQNELFLIMLDSIGDVLRDVRDAAYNDSHVGDAGLRAHRAIALCVASHDPEGARAAMIDHLAQAEAVWLGTTPTRSRSMGSESKGRDGEQ